jgi:hypothetical protein
VKKILVWFALGFIAGYAFGAVRGFLRDHPQDTTKRFPQFSKVADDLGWLHRAHVESVGAFLVVSPSDTNVADVCLTPLARPHSPLVTMHDSDSRGIPTGIQIFDHRMRSFTIRVNRDGDF